MPRVGGSGPFRGRGGPVLSNNSSDDERGGVGSSAQAWRPGGPSAWKDTEGQSGQAASALFEQYLAAGTLQGDDLGKDQVFQSGLSRIRDHLTNVDSSCCLICLNHIRPDEAVWSCERGCYTVLHLEWARSQLDAAGAKAAARLSQFPAAAEEARAAAEWGCPKCRCTYPAADIPRQYKCFCGKVTNPEFDPWVTPHTCGELCGRPLPGDCGHTCLLLCHPGPCPPCPLLVDASCHCGRLRTKRRCGHHEYSCDGVCGSRLECGHSCPDLCHPGECAPCRVMGDFKCRCGAERRRLPCGERRFQCERVCGKPLACGNHTCEQVCHSGRCGECPFSGARTCPCGKVAHSGMSCAERAPTCGATCGKLLPCGIHRCNDRCHHGECTAQCRGPVVKTCRCGKSQKEVLCFQEFTCERRCGEMRACGRHPCKRRCCDGNCPPCEEVCGRRLKCGNHKCPAPCHSGPCRPCPLTVTISCACGAAHCTLPCGAESKAVPPHCSAACSVPRICRHGPQLPPHRCHFGPCPPCNLPCGTPLACGHSCAEPACHDPAPPPVPDFKPPPPPKAPSASASAAAAGVSGGGSGSVGVSNERGKRNAAAGSVNISNMPAVQESAQLALQMLAASAAACTLPSACPACSQPVMVACVGGHGSRAMPCCEQRPYRCTAPCGRPLACGNHTCALPCHAVAPAGAPAGSASAVAEADPRLPLPCKQCDRRCERPRGCSHPCPLSCHQGPCPRCEVVTRTACMCGKSTLQLPCYEATAAVGAAKGGAKAGGGKPVLSCGKPCHKQLMYCPHPCKAICHAGPCPDPETCSAEVSVRCACPAKRRAKWKCSEVQAALLQAGKPRTYDDTQAPRLLPCDAECERAKAKAAIAAPKSGAGALTVSHSTESLTDVAAASSAGGEGGGAKAAGKVRLSRAEREALAAKKEAERRRQERLQAVVRGVVLAVVVLLGVLLALGAKALLARLDKQAQQWWALEK
ncbi:hypothetical protein Agub_g2071 [Astrephomene gubernaculifera]|uniref:NF-X1-type domain-containing protein n=1 Tax=Astrephomene gubernaculifera TaxID=47775 RepID=A0AAD3HI05_9CHLO|nr:hypothetical protein Agub_g2071 [Astrephomene gubernaculifera]